MSVDSLTYRLGQYSLVKVWQNSVSLNYLFRATSGGLNTVAGLRAVENVPGLENVDVTDKIAGHMSPRADSEHGSTLPCTEHEAQAWNATCPWCPLRHV